MKNFLNLAGNKHLMTKDKDDLGDDSENLPMPTLLKNS